MTKYLQRQLISISHRLKNLIDLSKEDDVKRKERLTENYNLALSLIEKLNDENYVVNNNELLYVYCEYTQFVEESKARERKQKQKSKELSTKNFKRNPSMNGYKKINNSRQGSLRNTSYNSNSRPSVKYNFNNETTKGSFVDNKSTDNLSTSSNLRKVRIIKVSKDDNNTI